MMSIPIQFLSYSSFYPCRFPRGFDASPLVLPNLSYLLDFGAYLLNTDDPRLMRKALIVAYGAVNK